MVAAIQEVRQEDRAQVSALQRMRQIEILS